MVGGSKSIQFASTKCLFSAFRAYAITAGSELVRGMPKLWSRQSGVMLPTEYYSTYINPSTTLSKRDSNDFTTETFIFEAVILKQLVQAFFVTRDRLALPPLFKASRANA